MTLSEAITAVETAGTTLSNSDSALKAATEKFESAQAAKTASESENAGSTKAYNDALNALIVAATAAIRPVA